MVICYAENQKTNKHMQKLIYIYRKQYIYVEIKCVTKVTQKLKWANECILLKQKFQLILSTKEIKCNYKKYSINLEKGRKLKKNKYYMRQIEKAAR